MGLLVYNFSWQLKNKLCPYLFKLFIGLGNICLGLKLKTMDEKIRWKHPLWDNHII